VIGSRGGQMNPSYYEREASSDVFVTRYCHYQYCMVCIAIKSLKGGRVETRYFAIVWAIRGGGEGIGISLELKAVSK